MRRLRTALLRDDPHAADDRGHSRALAVGAALATVGLLGCTAFAVVRPRGELTDHPILLDRSTGALYVRVGAAVHPVLNLASARLVAGRPDTPAAVRGDALADTTRGALLGIPGAPDVLTTSTDAGPWSVCDVVAGAPAAVVGTTVLAGGERPAAGDGPVLVSSGRAAYLLYDGRRARVDLTDSAVTRILQLDGVAPRPVSAALLNAVPEQPPITTPAVPGAGRPGPAGLSALPVGTVLRVRRTGGDEYAVVLADGVQPVSRVAADLLRAADSRGTPDAVEVAPDVLARIPLVHGVAVDAYPTTATRPVDGAALCVTWTAADGPADIAVAPRLPLPAGRAAVALAQADGPGPAADAAYLPPGRSVYARAAVDSGPLQVVTDTGVRFGVPDQATAAMLGLPAEPVAAPWPLLKLLPAGPELSRGAALLAHDAVGVDRGAVPLPQPAR